MALADEQLAALGLAMPPPDPTMAAPPAAILPSSAPPTYPKSILGDQVAPGAKITHADLLTLPHEVGKQLYQDEKPDVTAPAGTIQWNQQRQQELAYNKAHPWGAPISAHPGVLGSILHGLATAGNIEGDIVAPGVMADIPGTQMHNDIVNANLQRNIERQTSEEGQNAARQAQTAGTEAQTEKTKAETENLENPQAKVGTNPEELTMHDLMTGNNGAPRINPGTNKPYTYPEAYMFLQQAKQDVKPDKDHQTREITRVVGGVPHTVMVDAVTGADIKDEGQTKIPGESSADKRSAQESAQVEREARVNIRKAEGQYRDTQKSVAQLKSAIDASKDGNGLLTSFAPTMEVLGINAANGVHRISPAEAQAANLPGGWSERFNAWFDKATTGKLSPQLQTEGKQLADMLAKTSHDRYKATYNDESNIVEGYGGKDFGKRVPMIQEEGGAGGHSFTLNGQRYENVPDEVYKRYKGKPGFSE
jgi:hypothetical protein